MIINIDEKRKEILQTILKKKSTLSLQVDNQNVLVIHYHDKAFATTRFGIICDKGVAIRNGDKSFFTENCEITGSVICAHGGRSFYSPLRDGNAEVCNKETPLSTDFTFAVLAATEKTIVLILADGALDASAELAFFSTEKQDQRFALLSFFSFLKLHYPNCVAEASKALNGGEDNGGS